MKLKEIMIKVVIVSLFTYFFYHFVDGKRSIFALIKKKQELVSKQKEFDLIHSERLNLEYHISLLSSKSLDLDFLDEQARKILGYSKEDEIVYYDD